MITDEKQAGTVLKLNRLHFQVIPMPKDIQLMLIVHYVRKLPYGAGTALIGLQPIRLIIISRLSFIDHLYKNTKNVKRLVWLISLISVLSIDL